MRNHFLIAVTATSLFSAPGCSKKDSSGEIKGTSSNVTAGDTSVPESPEGQAASRSNLGFLTSTDFEDTNPSESLIPGNIKKFLVGERTFKNPFYVEELNLPNAGILADTACPEEMWKTLTATLIDKNTVLINAVKGNGGYSIGYNCRTAPEDSELNFRSFALVQGNFYYYAHCPNTDLSQFAGEGIREIFPLNNGNTPKICPDDPEVKVMMQFHFDLQTELTFTLFNGDNVITQEHNTVKYNFGASESTPCPITKEGDQFTLSGCTQVRWQQLTKYDAWTNGEKDPPVYNGTQTQFYHSLNYTDLTFHNDEGRWQYGSGTIDFRNGNLSGSVAYGSESPTYTLKDVEGAPQTLPWDETSP